MQVGHQGLCVVAAGSGDHNAVGGERLAPPPHRDEPEQAVLDVVPLARPRRHVAHRDHQPEGAPSNYTDVVGTSGTPRAVVPAGSGFRLPIREPLT